MATLEVNPNHRSCNLIVLKF